MYLETFSTRFFPLHITFFINAIAVLHFRFIHSALRFHFLCAFCFALYLCFYCALCAHRLLSFYLSCPLPFFPSSGFFSLSSFLLAHSSHVQYIFQIFMNPSSSYLPHATFRFHVSLTSVISRTDLGSKLFKFVCIWMVRHAQFNYS